MYPELFSLIGLRYDDREDDGLTFKITSMRGWCVDIPISWHAQGAYHAMATRPTAQANVGQIEIFFAQPLGPQPEFRRWTDEATLCVVRGSDLSHDSSGGAIIRGRG